jgi:hypothetical protein
MIRFGLLVGECEELWDEVSPISAIHFQISSLSKNKRKHYTK